MAEKKAGKQNTKTKSRQTKKKLVIVESPTKVESKNISEADMI